MRKTVLAALAATMLCGSADATVTYSFTSTLGSFTYNSDEFITGEVFTNGKYASCTTTRLNATCGSMYDELNATFAGGAYNQVGFGYTEQGGSQGALYYYFNSGAFQTLGAHVSIDANAGTLIVTQAAVPEPATWAMMIGGLGMIGATMRRRKVAVSFA